MHAVDAFADAIAGQDEAGRTTMTIKTALQWWTSTKEEVMMRTEERVESMAE